MAVATLNRALSYYCESGDVDRAVAVAEYPFYPLIGQGTGNDQLIARALALLPDDSPLAGPLLSRYGRLLGLKEVQMQKKRADVRVFPSQEKAVGVDRAGGHGGTS